MEHQDHTLIYWLGNFASASAIVTTLLGILPSVAAIVALVWYLIQIYESQTIQVWIAKRRVQRIARLQAKLLILTSKPAPLPPGMEEKL